MHLLGRTKSGRAMKKRNKILIIAGIVIAALVILVVGAGLYLQSRADKIIQKEFARLTHNRYRLTSGKIDVSLFNRSVTLNNLNIAPNPDAPPVSDTLPAMPLSLVDFSARELFIAGIHFNKRNDATNIKIRRLRVQAPKVKVQQMRGGDKVPKSGVKVTPVKIGIGRIIVSNGYAEYSQLNMGDTLRNVIEGFELQTEKFLIDTGNGITASALGDNTRLLIAKITHMSKDQSMRMEIDSVALETAAQTLSIASLAMIPTYSKGEFGYKAWHHKDWSRGSFSGISCHSVDFARLLSGGELHIDSAYLSGGGFSSYKNRNIERTEWIKPMHYQLIQRIPVKFSVRTAAIGSFDAQYEELKAGGDKAGIITFNKIGGRIDGLTNIPTPGRAYSEWRLHAELMDAGTLTVTGFMPIDSLNDRFELIAVLGKTDPTVLNSMITPLANIAVSDGTINKMDLRIVGNSHRATIDMTFLYNDLKVTIFKEKDGRLKERSLLSGIANHIAIIDSNPLRKETRTAHQTNTRDPYRSPWNYLWRTVFAGAKETIGLGKL